MPRRAADQPDHPTRPWLALDPGADRKEHTHEWRPHPLLGDRLLAAPAGLQEADSLLRGFGFQRDQPAPHSWQTGECLDDQGVEIAEELRAVAVRHRFAFEVTEEATDFDMGRRYTYLPDQDVLHQTTIGNDRNHYLLVQQVWDAIDQTTTREELVQTLETASGRHIERGLQAWRHDHNGPPAIP